MGARKLGRERLETIPPAGDEKEIMPVMGKKLRVFSAESGRRPCDQCGCHRHHFLMKPNRRSPVFSGCNDRGPPMMSLCPLRRAGGSERLTSNCLFRELFSVSKHPAK